MKRMKRHIRPLFVALGIAVLFSALGLGVVLAEGGGDGDTGKRARAEERRAAFAEALGVTAGELDAAFKQVALDRIDAAVEAGKLTEEQAAEARAKIESGELGDRAGKGRLGHAFKRARRGVDADGADGREALAAALGVTVDDLAAARRQVALDRVDAAVEAGKITEEQAAAMRAAIESGEKPDFGKGKRGHDRGFRKGHDGDCGKDWNKDGSSMEKPGKTETPAGAE